MADTIRDIVFAKKHLIALKNVVLPEGLLNGWEAIHDLGYQTLLNLNYFCHSVGSRFRVIDIGDKAFEAKDLSCEHRFLIDHIVVGKLDDASSFLDKKYIFSNL